MNTTVNVNPNTKACVMVLAVICTQYSIDDTCKIYKKPELFSSTQSCLAAAASQAVASEQAVGSRVPGKAYPASSY